MTANLSNSQIANNPGFVIGALDSELMDDAFKDDSKLIHTLLQISQLAGSAEGDASFYRQLHQYVSQALYADNFFIALTDDDVSYFKIVYYVNHNDELDPEKLNNLPLEQLQNSFSAYTVRQHQTILLDKAMQEKLEKKQSVKMIGKHSEYWLGIPIKNKTETVGILVLQSYQQKKSFSPKDVSIAIFIANSLASVIANRKYQKNLEIQINKATSELANNNKLLNQKVAELTRSELIQKILHKLSKIALRTDTDIEQYCAQIHNEISQLVYAKNFFVVLADSNNKSFSFAYFVDSVDPVSLDEMKKVPAERMKESLTGQVISGGKSILINEKEINRLVASKKISIGGAMTKIWLGTPLITEGKIVGAMIIQSYEDEHDIVEKDRALMEFVANHIATYIERKQYRNNLEDLIDERTKALQQTNRALAKQIDETQRAERLQKILYQLSEVSAAAKSDEQIYAEIHKIISALIYAENFYIALKEPFEKFFKLVYYVDSRDDITAEGAMSFKLDYEKRSLTRDVYDKGCSVLYNGKELCNLYSEGIIDSIGPQSSSWLGVPLVDEGDVIGVIAVQSYNPNFQYQNWHQELLEYVSRQVISTIQKGHANVLLQQRIAERTQALEEEISQRTFATKTQEVLYQISELSTAEMPIYDFYKSVHKTIAKLIYAENFYIALFKPETGNIEFEYFVDSLDQETLQSLPAIHKSEIDKSLTGYVFRQGEPQLLDNGGVKKLAKQLGLSLRGPDCICWLAIPLILENQVMGVMTLQSYIESQIYDQQDLMLMVYVSQHIATALQRFSNKQNLLEQVDIATKELRDSNKKLVKEISQRQKTEQLQRALFRISETPTLCHGMSELYQKLHSIIAELMYAESFYIALVDNKNNRFDFDYVVDQVDMDVPEHLPMGKGITSYVYKRGKITRLKPDDIAKLEKQGQVEHFGTYSVDWIGVPLKVDGVIHGIMVIQSYDDQYMFTEQDIEILEFVSQHIANALQRQQSAIQLQTANQKLHEKTVKAEAANEAKSQFLATMSHEIRTPMNGVMGMLSLLKDTSLNKQQTDYVQKIDQSANSLLSLINDILDFSKIEQGKMDLESIEFSLLELIDRLVDLFSARVREKNLQFNVIVDHRVNDIRIGDPLRISQILINLVSNAVKFTHRGVVELVVENKEENVVSFSVRDSGIGLNKEQADRIFDSFTQADGSTTRKFGGSGLGLSICKHLSKLMGGNITLESIPNRGSCFCLNLPLLTMKNKILIKSEENTQPICHIFYSNGIAQNFEEYALRSDVDLRWHNPPTDKFELIKAISVGDEKKQKVVIFLDVEFQSWMASCLPQLRNTTPSIKIYFIQNDEIGDMLRKGSLDWILHYQPPLRQSDIDKILHGKKLLESGKISHYKIVENKIQKEMKNKNALLVEDNPVNQQVANELLKKLNLQVDIANNGQEAVAMCKRKIYQIILMDVQMPLMDGFEATAKIRQLESYQSVPVIAMTANVMKGDREKCLQAGMNDYIGKPIDRAILADTLHHWIGMNNDTKKLTTPAIEKEIDSNAKLSVFNINSLEDKLQDTDLVKTLVNLFVETHKNDSKKLVSYIDTNNFEAAQKLTHKIKGSSGELECEKLYHSAKNLNEFLKISPEKDSTELVNSFCTNLDTVIKLFNNMPAS